jgi:hypothetical protein
MSNLVKKVNVLVLCTLVLLPLISIKTAFGDWIKYDSYNWDWNESGYDSGLGFSTYGEGYSGGGDGYAWADAYAEAWAEQEMQIGSWANSDAWACTTYYWDYGSSPSAYYSYKVEYEGYMEIDGDADGYNYDDVYGGTNLEAENTSSCYPEGYDNDYVEGYGSITPFETFMFYYSSISGYLGWGDVTYVSWDGNFENDGYLDYGFGSCSLNITAYASVFTYVYINLNNGGYGEVSIYGDTHARIWINYFDIY